MIVFTANFRYYISKKECFPGWAIQMVKNEMWEDTFTTEKSSRELFPDTRYTVKATIHLYYLLRYVCY